MNLAVFKSNDRFANTAFPTKAEFLATMIQLYGNRVSYTDMYGAAKDVATLAAGRLYLDGMYVGFWAAE